MNKTIENLSKICNEYRFKEKLFFVPSYSIGHQLGEHLAKSGTSWINLRVTTAVGYAQELIAPELSKAEIRLIESGERPIIIEKLYLSDDLTTIKCKYFEAAEEVPGILKCLGNAVHEIRMAGLQADDLNPGTFISQEKGEELIRLLNRYDRFLEDNRIIDHAGLLHTAIRKCRERTTRREDNVVMVLSDFPLTRLEKDLICTVGGKDILIIGHNMPSGLDFPGRFFRSTEQVENQATKPKSNIDLLSWVFKPEETPGPFDDKSVSMFHALGESNEIRDVFRRILKKEMPLDDVEILATTVDPYIPMIYEISASLDIPVTFAGGIPITYTRPGRAVILYLEWQSEDFSASCLKRLLSAGLLRLDSISQEGEAPSSGRAARIIRDAAIGWGRERYLPRLKALEDSYLRKAEENRKEGEENIQWAEDSAKKVAWVRALVGKILAAIPEPDPDGTIDIKELCKETLHFVNKFCRTASAADVVAKTRIVDELESLSNAFSFTDNARKARERLIKVIHGLSVYHSNPRPGHIHVGHYRSGGYSGRTNTFVLGFDQSRFPGPPIQDPVILDAERQKIGADLVISGELMNESSYLMAKTLGSLNGNVTLSYSCRDLREDRDIFPSSFLLGIYRLITPDRDGNYDNLIRFLGKPAGFIPETDLTPLTGWEWWLSRKGQKYGNDSVYPCYPHLLDGQSAEEARDSEEFGEYDGWIPSAQTVLDPLNHDVVISSSRMEDLAKCPYAYFIRHVLGVESLEEMEKDANRWLDPPQRGELLHEVFRRFMEELKERSELPDFEMHLRHLKDIASEEIEAWKIEIPPPNELVFDNEVTDINQTLEIFLKSEEEHCKEVEPYFFELSFGIASDSSPELSDKDPIQIKLGNEGFFRLRGRIDRVDHQGDHKYQVWDYKTGSAWGYDDHGYVNQGKHLQHALYALAAETLLRAKFDKKAMIVRAGYFFPGTKGEGVRILRDQPVRDVLYKVLADLFSLLREGVFPASNDKDLCNICSYKAICGDPDSTIRRTVEKMKEDEKLAPFERLKGHA